MAHFKECVDQKKLAFGETDWGVRSLEESWADIVMSGIFGLIVSDNAVTVASSLNDASPLCFSVVCTAYRAKRSCF